MDTEDFTHMVKSFRMQELQMLLGFAGRNKVGRKNELQARALELLRLKSTPIQMKIRELYKGCTQKQNDGPARQQQYLPPVFAQLNQDYYSKGFPPSLGTMPNNLPVLPDVRMKRLPFYDLIGELLRPSTLMPVGTARIQEQTFVFHFTPVQANEIALNRIVGSVESEYIVQAQMRFCLLETSCEQDDCFPPGIIVKVNDKACPLPTPIPTNKQGEEPKRPPRPVDISTLVRMSPTVANTIYVSWAAEFGRGYVISINLVKKLTSAQLIRRLRNKGVRPADYTTGLIKEKLREDGDSEIATTSLRVSLLCPLGKMRMLLPCRPTTCTHLQCFDANLYLQMNERKPTWVCPVCNQPGLYDNLVIDGYFKDVLSSDRLLADVSDIELHQDGSWSLSNIKEGRMNNATPPLVKTRGGPPVVAETLEIDDDDVIPLDSCCCTEKKPETKMKTEVAANNVNNVSTVDLTLSDDDDDITLTGSSSGPAFAGSSSNSKAPVKDQIPADIISLDSPTPPCTPEPEPSSIH